MIDSLLLRKALGQYATGIAVVTTMDGDGQPNGLTINSFNSVSLDPPLVLWSLARNSGNLDVFLKSGHFAVNVLSEGQMDLSNRFASPIPDRFDGVSWTKGETGSPVLADVVASLDCELAQTVEGGDHVILIGKVVDVSYSEQPPLLYHGGSYRTLAELPASAAE